MSKKNVKARKNYWASLSPEIRTERMREIGKKRWLNMSPEKQKEFTQMLNNARWKKENVAQP